MRRYIVDERETVGVFVASFYTEKKRKDDNTQRRV